MRPRISLLAVGLATVILSLAISRVHAGKFNRQLTSGDAAPTFTNLTGTDDQPHSLADYREAKVIVVIFTCNHCPVAKEYDTRLIKLQNDFKTRGVQFVAINPSLTDVDSLAGMKERAKESGFNFPYLRDATQAVAKAYGVRVTPEVYVLDVDRKIAFMGAIDDSLDLATVEHHYLRDAIESLLAGRTPETVESKPRGCPVQYE